jgi:ferredoxin-type protein NapH
LNPASTKRVAIIAGLLVGLFIFGIYYRSYLWLGVFLGVLSGLISFALLSSGRIQRLRRLLVIYYAAVTWTGTIIVFSYIGVASLLKWVGGHLRVYYYGGMPTVGTALVPCNFNLPDITVSIPIWGIEKQVQTVGGIPVVWPSSFFYLAVLVLVPYLATAVLLGRGFCGWVCYFGGSVDTFRRAGKPRWLLTKFRKHYQEPGKKDPALDGLREDIKDIKYGVAIGLLLLGVGLAVPFICIICWTWLLQYLWWGLSAIVVFGLFAVILPFMTGKRTWCTILCPVGALLNSIERITPFNVKIDSNKCTKDYSCTYVCPMFAMTRQTINEMYAPNIDCIKCGACIDQCPEGAIDLYLTGTSKKVRSWFIPLAVSAGMLWYIWFLLAIVKIAPQVFHI